jgi:hypothetical protein
MAVYNLNQVHHLYVAEKVVEKASVANAGDIAVVEVGSALGAVNKEIYFLTKGVDTVVKSDYIPVKSIIFAKATKAEDLATPLKKVKVTLDTDVNNGTPIVGQDYVLRINLRQFYGMGDQDQYFKDAAVRVTKSISTAQKFYEAMVDALNAAFSREVGATIDSNPYLTFTASASGITIEEKIQGHDGVVGVEAEERVYFDVVPTTVYCDGVDVFWGKSEVQPSTTKIDNGKKIADLEYFLLGERGDQYRKINWPNDIETKGLVDPTKAYNTLDIHYSFVDTGVNSYKTEKDVTIVATDVAVLNSLIAKINSATGLSIETLSTTTSKSDASSGGGSTGEDTDGEGE